MKVEVKEMEGVIWVSVEAVRTLSSSNGFRKIYEENLANSKTFTDAYEATEKYHEKIFGIRRYSNYNSFQQNNKK